MGNGNDSPDVIPETTDISRVTDVTTLKAMAYDQMVVAQTAQQNLGVINERISQLSTTIPATQPEG